MFCKVKKLIILELMEKLQEIKEKNILNNLILKKIIYKSFYFHLNQVKQG